MGGNGLVIRSADRGQNWSSSNPTATTLNGVHFVSDARGWAVGNAGVVIATADGGDNWSQTSPGSLNLNDVWFSDANHGWIVGDGGKVLRTVDGGTNWSTASPTTAALHGVYFLDSNLGWAAGNGVVLRTTNGGVNWIASSPTTAALRDVWFVDASTGWAVGGNGVVLKSVNGGVSWSSSTPTTSTLNAVHFLDASTGWAVGFTGSVIRTSDGGANWTEQRPVGTELRSVFFIDDRFGWAAGVGGVALRTVDGGDTWTVSNPASVALNGIYFASIPSGVSVTVNTDPPGRAFTVDGIDYTQSQTFIWEPGLPHTIATVSSQDGTAGTRYVWENWSDGGAISHTVTPSSNATYSARFETQHQLTMNSTGNGTVAPASGWHAAGAEVSLDATPDPGYGFNGWTGSGSGSYSGWANPAVVTMNGPVTESAAFGSDVTVVVNCVPSGRSFIVDGVTYTTPQQFTWVPGSSHTVDAPSPQVVGPDTRYVFSRWNDGGASSHNVAPVSNTTLTVTLKAQYTLTTLADAGGSVGPAGGWLDAGTVVTVTATPDSGYSFRSWVGSGNGSYSGSSNPRNVTINGPVTQRATFAVGDTPAVPASLTLLANAPNPFSTETEIRFGLSADADVRIEVFDVSGRRVLSDTMPGAAQGWQSYRFDAARPDVALPSGIYFVRVSAAGSSRAGRMLLLR